MKDEKLSDDAANEREAKDIYEATQVYSESSYEHIDLGE